MQYILGACLTLLLLGCGSETSKKQYNGHNLIKQKCAACHNLKMPPDTYEDEKAPPMMAVVFHLKDFMKITMEEEMFSKFIPFVQEYVIYPSREKSYCDKTSLDTYGVMPSQKGNVTKDELYAIATYMFRFYDQQKYLKQMQEKAIFDALPRGEQLVVKSGCYNCHDIHKDKVGPSFEHIALNKKSDIIAAIKNGSQNKWKDFHAMMPAYKNKFSEDELEILKEWIEGIAKEKLPKQWKMKNDI